MKATIERIAYEVLCRFAPKNDENRVISLCYHRILPRDCDPAEVDRYTVYMDSFDKQIQMIKNAGFQIINPADMYTATGKSAIITFDDNIYTHVKYALPVLQKHGATATFFLNPDELNVDGQMWDVDVAQLKEAGMVIGAHNAVHRVASMMSYAEFQQAALRCKEFLEQQEMDLYWAYPGGFLGSYTPRQDHLLRDLGFVRFSTLEGRCYPQHTDWVQSRYVLRINSSLAYFRGILQGRMRVLGKAKKAVYSYKKAKTHSSIQEYRSYLAPLGLNIRMTLILLVMAVFNLIALASIDSQQTTQRTNLADTAYSEYDLSPDITY